MLWPLALASLLSASPAGERPRLLVLDLTAQGGVAPDDAQALTSAVAAEVSARGFFQAVTSGDVQTILGVERKRQLLGCSDEAGSCLTELAGAMGARFILSGSVSKLGDNFQLTLQALDNQKAAALGRSVRLAKTVGSLQAEVALAVAEATATPLPPPPSHVATYSLLAAGVGLVIAGGVVGLHALSQESLLQSEIDQGQTNPAPLKTYAYYTQARSQYGAERTVSLAAMAAGAACVGIGLYVNPDLHLRDKLALVPAPNGAALVGTFR